MTASDLRCNVKRIVLIAVLAVLGSRLFAGGAPPPPTPRDIVFRKFKKEGVPVFQNHNMHNRYQKNQGGNPIVYLSLPGTVSWYSVPSFFMAGGITPHVAWFQKYVIRVFLNPGHGEVLLKEFTVYNRNQTTLNMHFSSGELARIRDGDRLQFRIYSQYRYNDWLGPWEYRNTYTRYSITYIADALPPPPPGNLRIDLGLPGSGGSNRGMGWYRNSDSYLYIRNRNSLRLEWNSGGNDTPHGSGVKRHMLEVRYLGASSGSYWSQVYDSQSISSSALHQYTNYFAWHNRLPSGRYRLRIRSQDNVMHTSTWGPEVEVILDTESPYAVRQNSISHHYTSNTKGIYDLNFKWSPSAGDRPAGRIGSGIYKYDFVFYRTVNDWTPFRTETVFLSSLGPPSNGFVSAEIIKDVAANLGLGKTYYVAVRTMDNVGNYSESGKQMFTVALDPGSGLSVDSDSISISGNASSPGGYSVPLNLSVPIPRSNSFVLYRDWMENNVVKNSTRVTTAHPITQGILTDRVPLAWAHRSIRYRLVDSQGRNILASNSVTLPNIPANLSWRFKNGENVQFEFPGSQESGAGNPAPLRGVGTPSDDMSVEPNSETVVRSSTGDAVDAEGDKVSYQIRYKYGSQVLSTEEVSALDSVNWRTEVARHTTPLADAALVIQSITVTEQNGSFRFQKVYEAKKNDFDIAIYFDSTAPSSGGDLAFQMFRSADTGLANQLNEEYPVNDISVLVSKLTFTDELSGIAGYLLWSTAGEQAGTIPDRSEWTEVEGRVLSPDARFDLSGHQKPVFLKLKDAAGWLARKRQPISGDQVIAYDLAPASENPQADGEVRRLHAAAVDAAGNITAASASTILDTVPPDAPRGIRNYSFQENSGIAGYSFSLDWDDTPSAVDYVLRVLNGGTELYSSVSAVSGLNDIVLENLGPEETLRINLRSRDAAGNLSGAVQYVVNTPPQPMRIASADITHLDTGRKRIDLSFAGESSGRVTGRLADADESIEFTWNDEQKTLSIAPVLPRADLSLGLFVVGEAPRLLDEEGVLIPGGWFAEPSRTAISGVDVNQISYDNRELTLRGFPEEPHRLGIRVLNAPPDAPEIIWPKRAARSDDLVLNWNASEDKDADELRYAVQMRSEGGAFRTLEFPVGEALGTESADTALSLSEVTNGFEMTHGQRYEWKVITREYIYDAANGRVRESEVSSLVSAFNVDNVAPVLRFPEAAGELFTNVDAFEVTIEEDGSSLVEVDESPVVSLSVDGAEAQTVQASAKPAVSNRTVDGTKFYTAVISLDEGEHRYRITARDIAGGQGEHTQIVRRDITAPQVLDLDIDLPLEEGTHYSASASIPVNVRLKDDYAGIKALKYGWSSSRTVPPNQFMQLNLSHGPLPAGDADPKAFSDLALIFDGEERTAQYLWVRAADWAGNELEPGYAAAASVYVDTGFPDVNVRWKGIERSNGRFFVRDASRLEPEADVDESSVNNQQITELSFSYGIEELGDDSRSPGVLWFPAAALLGDSGVFESGRSYRLAVKASNIAGTRRLFYSAPFLFDALAPRDIAVSLSSRGTVPPGAPMSAAVSGSDGESGIMRYRISLGSAAGRRDISSAIDGNSDGYLEIGGADAAQLRFAVPPGFSGPVYIALEAEDFAGNAAQITLQTSSFTIDESVQSIAVRDSGEWFTDPERLGARWEMIGGEAPLRWSYRVLRDDSPIIEWTGTELGYAEVDVSPWALEGARYSWEVRGVHSGGALSAPVKSQGSVLDRISPVINTGGDEAAPVWSRSDSLWVNWDVSESGSGLERVELLMRRYEGGVLVPVGGWRMLGSGSGALIGRNVPVSIPEGLDGTQLYLTLRAGDRAGLLTEFTVRPVLIDDSPPAVPMVVDQGDFLNSRYAPSFHWLWGSPQGGSPVSYRWSLNDSPVIPDNAVWYAGNGSRMVSIGDEGVLDPPFVTGALQQGRRWYLAVKAADAAGNESVGISNGIVMDGTAPLLSAVSILDAQGSILRYTDSLSGLSALVEADEDLGQEAITAYRFLKGFLDPSGDFQMEGEGIEAAVNRTEVNMSGREPGEVLMVKGRAVNAAGLSAEGLSLGTLYEPGYPAVGPVGALSSGDRLVFNWQGSANGSPIRSYEAAIKGASGGTPADAEWINLGEALSASYTAAQLPESSDGYRLYVRAVSESGRKSRSVDEEWGVSAVVTLDNTAPEITSFIYDRFTAERLSFSVSASDSGGGLDEYQYALGTLDDAFAYTGRWLGEFSAAGLFTRQLSYTQLSRALPSDGAAVILRVRVKDRSGNWSDIKTSDLITADQTPPSTPAVVSGVWNSARDHVDGVDVNARDSQSGIVAYRWTVLSDQQRIAAVESEDIAYAEAGEEFIFNLSDENLYGVTLEEDARYRAAFQVVNGSGLSSDVGYSEVFTVDSTAPQIIFTAIDAASEPAAEEGSSRVIHNGGELELPYTISEPLHSLSFDLIKPGGVSERLEIDVPPEGGGVYRFDESDYGVYRISARAVDLAGNVGSGVREVRVNAPPVIRFGNIETTSGKPLVFDMVEISDPEGDEPLTYRWSFGDASALSDEAVPTHTYRHSAAGRSRSTYLVTLTVRDSHGMEGSQSAAVNVVNTRSGVLYDDEYWRGEHFVEGSIVVPAGVVLTLRDGAVMKMAASDADTPVGITVNGRIVTEGAASFVPAFASGGYWEGIRLNADGSRLNGVTIRGARRGITVNSGVQFTLADASLESNFIGIHAYGSRLRVLRSAFIGNTAYAIKEDADASASINQSRFRANGAAYYHRDQTVMSISELNAQNGSSGNTQEVQ